MITKFSHFSIYVMDIDKAYDVYVNILGFKVHTDAIMQNGYRWLTVTAPDDPRTEIILMPVLHPGMIKTKDFTEGIDQDVQDAFRLILERGVMGSGVMYTPDCRATYEELKAKGMKFKSEPKEQFYGIEAVMFDGCGNWFSLTQPKEM